MERVIIIGCPGSGKSTFARALHEKTGLPLHYLDMMYWKPDRTTVEKAVFRAQLQELLTFDRWIIDGNYASTMEARMAACDTVFFLDYPTELCLDGVRRRRGTKHADLPWVETEEDAEFIAFVRGFREEQRPRMLELLEKHGYKNIIVFRTREEAEEFLHKEKEKH